MMREQMNIVIVGHVDHGKSSIIGRLLADTGALPEGKLEQVKATCVKNAKPFEYAFLLDALKDEQAQGITIDTARCFFKSQKRDYIILDAPGHIEFLKNMVTGAARAEAALLVIDAKEGIQENSKRHGHMVAMLGIKQVVVLVNKMDLVDYDKATFDAIKTDYTQFLSHLRIEPVNFIPISAIAGDCIITLSDHVPWYSGATLLDQMDSLHKKESPKALPFRFPVQDIYKFTEAGDDRRIVGGTVLSGSVSAGDTVAFLPSGKRSTLRSVEYFNGPARQTAEVGQAIGFTLTEQIYIAPGEVMVNTSEKPASVSASFKANIFWVGKTPMIKNKVYKLKLASARINVRLMRLISVLDASELSSDYHKQQIDRHDVCECVLETTKPIAFDLAHEIEETSRFVIVDNYEIVGGGIILDALSEKNTALKQHIKEREAIWDRGLISEETRTAAYGHRGKFVVLVGHDPEKTSILARQLEKKLFDNKFKVYYLGFLAMDRGLDADLSYIRDADEHIRRLGELARIMTDCGLIFISTCIDSDDYDIEKLKLLTAPHDFLVVNAGDRAFSDTKPDLVLSEEESISDSITKMVQLLKEKDIFLEYYL